MNNQPPEVLTSLPTPTLHTASRTSQRIIATQSDRGTAVADATGKATVEFGPVPNFAYWLVQAITVETDSAAATEARVYVGGEQAGNLVDGTTAGNLDISDRSQPILVPGGETLRVVWTGATVGAQATARIQYQLAQIITE